MTSRELTLSLVALVLLSLTGSASRAPADALPQLPPAPAVTGPAATPIPRPVRPPAPSSRPAAPSKPAPVPRIPIVNAAPQKAPRISTDDYPARVKVAALDLSMPIKPVGVTKKGEMELPRTNAEVGWYRFGANPSSRTGTTVLAAHVDTRAEGVGPFVLLREIKVDTAVTVTDESGDRREYRVAKVQQVDKEKIDWNQVFDEVGHPRLVMITCGGTYDQESGYRDNVLVTAFPIA